MGEESSDDEEDRVKALVDGYKESRFYACNDQRPLLPKHTYVRRNQISLLKTCGVKNFVNTKQYKISYSVSALSSTLEMVSEKLTVRDAFQQTDGRKGETGRKRSV